MKYVLFCVLIFAVLIARFVSWSGKPIVSEAVPPPPSQVRVQHQRPLAAASPLLSPEPLSEILQQTLAATLIDEHPLKAVEILADLPQSFENDQMLRQAGMEYATDELATAYDWARAQPVAEVRSLLVSGVLCVLAETDPSLAVNLALQEIPAGYEQEHTVVEIMQRWVQLDAAAAADCLLQLPADLADAATPPLVSIWLDLAPANCDAWAATLPEGGVRDATATYKQELASRE